MASPRLIETEMTVVNATAQRDALQAWVREATRDAAPPDLELDLSGVDAIDSAGVQLLLAARASLAHEGRRLRVSGAQHGVLDALHVYGLRELLVGDGADA